MLLDVVVQEPPPFGKGEAGDAGRDDQQQQAAIDKIPSSCLQLHHHQQHTGRLDSLDRLFSSTSSVPSSLMCDPTNHCTNKSTSTCNIDELDGRIKHNITAKQLLLEQASQLSLSSPPAGINKIRDSKTLGVSKNKMGTICSRSSNSNIQLVNRRAADEEDSKQADEYCNDAEYDTTEKDEEKTKTSIGIHLGETATTSASSFTTNIINDKNHKAQQHAKNIAEEEKKDDNDDSGNVTTPTNSIENHHQKKGVKFSIDDDSDDTDVSIIVRAQQVHEILHHHDYTDEERTLTWYSPIELSMIRQSNASVVDKIENELSRSSQRQQRSEDDDDGENEIYCIRGLELQTNSVGSKLRRRLRDTSKQVVFNEQFEQQRQRRHETHGNAIVTDSDTNNHHKASLQIAELYKMACERSLFIAQTLGKKDEMVAMQIQQAQQFNL